MRSILMGDRRLGWDARRTRVSEEMTRPLQALGYVGGEREETAARPVTWQPRSPVEP